MKFAGHTDLGCNTSQSATTGETPDRCPLSIAARYRSGVRHGFWATQAEAAPFLKVTQGEVSNALAVARLPDTILDAFEAREVIGFGVAAKLVTIRRKVGLDAMCLHAGALHALPNKLPVKRVLAVLANGEFRHADNLVNDLEIFPSDCNDLTACRTSVGYAPSKLRASCQKDIVASLRLLLICDLNSQKYKGSAGA